MNRDHARVRKTRTVFAVWTLAILLPILGWSQTNTGRLVGTVYDATGAVVPRAIVTVTDSRTAIERTTASDESGSFIVPLLNFGTYTVTVRSSGFKTFTNSAVIIQVGRDFPLMVNLEVGNVETVVDVSASAAQVNQTTGEISTTIGPAQIMNLPLIGRNPLNLVLTLAGSSSNSAQNTSISGQRTAFTNITRDGINVQDAFIRSNATDFSPARTTVDDTEEITITTQNAGADQGYGAAQIRFVTPRGGSDFHGAAWDYNRNSKFAANDFFNNRSGLPRPFRNRNQFGGKLSGPVPGLEQKVFFFGFYEGIRDVVTSQTTRTLYLPDARRGIFTYRNNAGATNTVDLFSLVPGIGTIDPVISSRLLGKMPTAGNRTDVGDQLNTTGLTLNQPSNTDRNTVTTRGDYEISTMHSVNVVFSRNSEVNLRPDVNSTQGFYAVHPVDQTATNKHFVAAHRWLISPIFSNEVRGGLFFSGVPFNRRIERPEYFIVPSTFTSNPEVTFLDQGRNTRYYNLQDSAEKAIQRHNLRFGGMMQLFEVDSYNNGGIVPTYTTGTNPNTPALAVAMFPGGISTTQFNNATAMFTTLAGIVASGTQSFNVKDKTSGFQPVSRFADYRYSNWSLYVNDQWRATSRLTLNLGVRYEILNPVKQLNGLALEPVIPAGTDPVKAILDPNGTYNYVGGNSGSTRFFKPDRNNFAPVLSFAYTPRFENPVLKALFGEDVFVLRGGYRQTYVNDSNLTSSDNAVGGNVGLGTTSVSAINPLTGTAQLNARFGTLPSFTPPALIVPRTYVQNNSPAFSNFGTVFAVDPNIQTTRVHEYNLGIQRSIGWAGVLEIRYVGARSNNLWRGVDYNQIDIRQNGFADDFNRARRNLLANNSPSVGEPLTVFPLLGSGGLLTNATVQTNIRNGVPADLALLYIQNQLTGTVKFLANPNTGVADLLTNAAKYRYNSLQVEVRKQLSHGIFFTGNYTWQKILTDGIGTSQALFEPPLDLANQRLEYTRADYDTAHTFNFNSVYSLPIGRNRHFLGNIPAWADRIIGGWQISGITRITSGTPTTIVDPRGTLNRAGRSTRQTPNMSISVKELRKLAGRFENTGGIYFINPSIVNTATGRAAEGIGSTPFAGQVFFNVEPGTTGALGRAVLDGPRYVNVDAALLKDIPLTERVALQLRADASNVFNHANLYMGQLQNINSTSFGKLQSAWSPRIFQFAARVMF